MREISICSMVSWSVVGKAPNGASYWFGGLNQSNLKLPKWLMVGPRPGLVQTIDYWFGLLVNGPKAFMILTHNNNTK